ncbi:MAG: rhamnogalacturonan acetylesterase [Bacteroidota bacterium]
MKRTSFIAGFLVIMAFGLPAKKKITVWLIGDSTMSVKEKRTYPETGWGMPFAGFWDSTVTVDNRARNGRSSKSFIAEKLWQPVLDHLQEGDYVFIQFGHNDESKEKGERYSAPDEFKANLLRYVTECRSKKAIPVLITPVARRKFDDAGSIKESHGEYPALVKQVAAENNVLLIDLNEKSKALLQQLGPEASKYLFNYLTPGEHPNYPDGLKDDTHFNELGARKMAQIVLAEIRNLKLELAEQVIVPPVKK